MMPVLLELPLFGWNLSLPTYGTVLALAFLAALWAALRQARRAGVEPNLISDLWIISLIAGVVGAKLLLYLLDLDYYLANPRAILTTLRSAGVYYGGLLAALGACLWIVRRRGLDAWLIGDVLAPAIILGQGVGRWGCFAAGCCYGKPTSLPWAVTFTDPRAHEITGVPLHQALHPVQLYLSAADFAAFGVLLWVAARKRFNGQVLLLYFILYAVLRGSLESLRGDPRGELLGLSTSQAISIATGIAALALYVLRSRSARGSAGRLSSGPRGGGGRKRREAPAP
ncbi:MAG TPA: prolipoprotein diacylglyceryl transferase [Candidatus Polarisedimenticolia bacterium]|nr:prolipoprotein diacylglyceryl transferase [Candidatus Polarisedimenticolia bacterium]